MKDVLVKRFVFRNSVEANICELHKAISRREVSVVDGSIPPSGIQVLCRGQV